MSLSLCKIIVFSFTLILTCPNSLKVKEEKNLVEIWRLSTSLIDSPKSELLIIDNEKLVYSGEEELIAISTNNADLIWNGEIENGRALYNWNEMLYHSLQERIISTHYDNIIVWNAKNGEKLYELTDSKDGLDASRVGHNTLLDDGFAIIGSSIDFYLFNWNGNLRSEYNIDWKSRSLAYNNGILFTGQSNTVNGGLTQGRIRAFNSLNGDSLWVYQTNNGGFNTKLFVKDGNVYGAARGNSPLGEIVALNESNGNIVWVYNEKDKAQTQNLAISDSKIYANTGGGITALNLENGVLEWRVDWMGFDSNKPVYNNGYVYHVRSSELLIINDDTGEVEHRVPVPKDNGQYWHITATDEAILVQTSASIIAYKPWHLRGE
jgi:outer membrane protein assembly factor BamB